ncbi:MAG: hypothetical protein RLZZ628_2359 [Bacteroidota bacterium]|jgi:predicted short-subunit dehydrogenase-like oxidoreductase (DUF2520 family)
MISIIGTGNVAHHLAKRLHQKGIPIDQIYGRNAAAAQNLAQIVSTKTISKPSDWLQETRVCIVAVSDAAIPMVAETFSTIIAPETWVVHTAGTTPSTVFKPFFKQFGSLYPFQSFTVGREPDFEQIPIFVNANQPDGVAFLKTIAAYMSPKVYELLDEKRIALHIAGVLVNNFTNHLFQITQNVLKLEDLPFEIVLPLLEETVLKIQHASPHAMQTGPAKRGDFNTIRQHLTYLKKLPISQQNVYKVLTDSLLKEFNL